MSKVIVFTILGGLVLAAIAVINIDSVSAQEDTRFIPISVLSKNQANYGIDENLGTIPAVSTDILEDKFRDAQQKSSIPIIRYTSLPAENNGATGQDNGNAQSGNQGEPHNNQGNNGNSGLHPPGGGNSNQDMNNNGNGSTGGNNNSNNGQQKEKEKETGPDKSSAPQDKATAPENKDTASGSASENKNTSPGSAPEAAPDK